MFDLGGEYLHTAVADLAGSVVARQRLWLNKHTIAKDTAVWVGVVGVNITYYAGSFARLVAHKVGRRLEILSARVTVLAV
jgi:hypothetical protein